MGGPKHSQAELYICLHFKPLQPGALHTGSSPQETTPPCPNAGKTKKSTNRSIAAPSINDVATHQRMSRFFVFLVICLHLSFEKLRNLRVAHARHDV